MCNRIHKEHEPIKKTGVGWKLFRTNHGHFYPLCKVGRFNAPTKEWVMWDEEHPNVRNNDAGFCFFLDEQEAEDTHRYWGTNVLRKIAYRRGICRQVENSFRGGHVLNVALCKSFKILKKGE